MKKSLRLRAVVSPTPTVIAAAYDENGKADACTLAFYSPTSHVPPCATFAINATAISGPPDATGYYDLFVAALDVRIKATVAVTMYDMNRVEANGYFDKADTLADRRKIRVALAAQRNADAKSGQAPKLTGGVPDVLPDNAPWFFRDYHAYYKMPRGYHARSLNSTGGFTVSSRLSLINTPLLAYAGEIESAVMIVHGEKAHSRYFGEDAFKLLKGDNKELVIVPGASHCDLYDGGGKNAIPFDKIEAFYRKNLK